MPRSEYISEAYIDMDSEYQRRNHGQAVIKLLHNEVPLLRGYVRHVNSEELHRIIAPVLIFWGKQDKTIPLRHAEPAFPELSNYRLVVFDDGGHRPHISHPDEVSRYCLEFIEQGYIEDEQTQGKTVHILD